MTDTIDVHDFETEDQRAERISEWRLARALSDASEILAHVRAIALSHPEPGETFTAWNAPMRITAQDNGDELYSLLVAWVEFFSAQLSITQPATVIAAQRLPGGAIQGFRAHVTEEGAGALAQILTTWLRIHHDQISRHPDFLAYRESVTEGMRELRVRYPLDEGQKRPVHPRPCPACGERAVHASWWSENAGDVAVECGRCEYQVPPSDYRQILEWVTA